MPSCPADTPRSLIHARRIECLGYLRQDGLWDIEASLHDTKTYDFSNRDRGTIKAGEPLHGMTIRLTIDSSLLIHGAQAVTQHAPFHECPNIASAYKKLEGLTIGKGFEKHVHSLLQGPCGCTHLTELLRPLATTAIQTIMSARVDPEQPAHQKRSLPPALMDRCYALRAEGSVAAREWPQTDTPPGNS